MVGPVHCYTWEQDGDLILFDTGPPTDSGAAYLKTQVDLDRLKHVIVTHCHIDHYGQAAWLEENSDATLYLPYRDVMKATHHEARMSGMLGLLEEMGFTEDYRDTFQQTLQRGAFPPFPEKYQVAERDIPARLGIGVLDCAGHSQSDLVYFTDDWAVTGDTLLRGIYQSPLLDIDLETGGRFKNYQAYCASVVKLAGLGGRRILPGHRESIESVESTILFYVSKTLHRVSYLRPEIANSSIADVIERVFPSMKDPFHIYLKASEIVFMRDFLTDPDLLAEALKKAELFSSVAESFYRAVSS
jgi:2,4-dienoyl-CoA reductase (NADPH2)